MHCKLACSSNVIKMKNVFVGLVERDYLRKYWSDLKKGFIDGHSHRGYIYRQFIALRSKGAEYQKWDTVYPFESF